MTHDTNSSVLNPDWDGIMKARARDPGAERVLLALAAFGPQAIRDAVDGVSDADVERIVTAWWSGPEKDRSANVRRVIREVLLGGA